jgi:hypothetical protein
MLASRLYLDEKFGRLDKKLGEFELFALLDRRLGDEREPTPAAIGEALVGARRAGPASAVLAEAIGAQAGIRAREDRPESSIIAGAAAPRPSRPSYLRPTGDRRQ